MTGHAIVSKTLSHHAPKYRVNKNLPNQKINHRLWRMKSFKSTRMAPWLPNNQRKPSRLPSCLLFRVDSTVWGFGRFCSPQRDLTWKRRIIGDRTIWCCVSMVPLRVVRYWIKQPDKKRRVALGDWRRTIADCEYAS